MCKLFIVGAFTVVISLFFSAGYYYWINHFNWYLDSFFVDEFEEYTDIELGSEAKVIWKWAAPRGGDRSPRYITAVIASPAFDISKIDARFNPQTECYKLSGGARRFLTESSSLKCWHDTDGPLDRDVFFMLYAKDENILLFKKSTD